MQAGDQTKLLQQEPEQRFSWTHGTDIVHDGVKIEDNDATEVKKDSCCE